MSWPTYTLTQARSRVRARVDMVGSAFVSDTMANEMLTLAVWETWELVQSVNRSYFEKQGTVSVSSGSQTATLPSDFYKLKALYLTVSNRPVPLHPYDADLVLSTDSQAWGSSWMPRYKLRNTGSADELRFDAPPSSAQTLTCLYIWRPEEYSSDATVIPVPFAEHYILGAAIRCLERERTDTSALQSERSRLEERIKQWASPIDSNPAGIRDARATEDTGDGAAQLWRVVP